LIFASVEKGGAMNVVSPNLFSQGCFQTKYIFIHSLQDNKVKGPLRKNKLKEKTPD
jgi:hypothetical protein